MPLSSLLAPRCPPSPLTLLNLRQQNSTKKGAFVQSTTMSGVLFNAARTDINVVSVNAPLSLSTTADTVKDSLLRVMKLSRVRYSEMADSRAWVRCRMCFARGILSPSEVTKAGREVR